ncbi:hypothetical protein BKA56DRAFT_676271 [Ilyonectria sp. MPI-CAGE-AT-0026]|nr:hypothetical protein BKA56DRAFT_676271 [Ilyonectria sp. MPI-CAGE-AT-0026]
MNPASGTTAVGSDSWIGVDNIDDAFHERIAQFVAVVKWDALLSLSSHIRSGIPCKLSDEFHVGCFYMVRRIVFDDQVSWVVRLRMPPIADERSAESLARIMQAGVAGMKFLKAKTDIPVPEVHSYNTEQDNVVGAPYILMDYIHGNVAFEMRRAKDCDSGLYGTPERDRSFRREMARIQAVLATFTFDQIGSLYQNPTTEEFFVGPDVVTDKGPWSNSSDYYADVAQHSLRVCVDNAEPEVLTSASFTLPVIFTNLMELCGGSDGNSSNGPAAPFCLTNRDLGPQSLLVDEEFHIVGVIDLDVIMAAPYEIAAQFPLCAGLDPEPPGHVETAPRSLEFIKRTETLIREYNGMVKEIEEGANSPGRKIWNVMLSNGARVVRGLSQYQRHNQFLNDMWIEAYTRLLSEHFSSTAPTSSAN